MHTRTIVHRIAAAALALTLLLQVLPAQAAPPPGGAEADELIVRLQPALNARRFAARASLKLLDQLPDAPIYRFAIADGTPASTKAASLTRLPGVIAVDPNYQVASPLAQRRVTWVVGSDDQSYASQWAPERLGLRDAHQVTAGAGVTVAILDTGVDPDHPALAGRLAAGYDFVADDADPREEGSAGVDAAYGHGTHVAGLVALVAPAARILPLRTLGPDGSGDLWTQLVALRYAVASGAQVINLSFSFGERSRTFDDLLGAVTCTTDSAQFCGKLRSRGAVVIAAAGNSGAAIREFPGASAVPGLLGVAATTQADTLADFSTFGPWLTLAAPGEAIVSAVPGGGYEAWSGTSMATPLVAGTAALVRSAYPQLGPAEVARQIVKTAAPIDAAVRHRLDSAAAVGAPGYSDDDGGEDVEDHAKATR